MNSVTKHAIKTIVGYLQETGSQRPHRCCPPASNVENIDYVMHVCLDTPEYDPQ